jgi:hypothetical protein
MPKHFFIICTIVPAMYLRFYLLFAPGGCEIDYKIVAYVLSFNIEVVCEAGFCIRLFGPRPEIHLL